jgi:hypothetical protein
MKNQVFFVRGVWKAAFNGAVLAPDWRDKGGAEACLELLERGKGEVTASGNIRWSPRPRSIEDLPDEDVEPTLRDTGFDDPPGLR